MLVTFYNAVICSIIMFDSVCWGGNISKLDRGRLEKIVKKAGHVVGKPLDSLKTLHEKRLYRTLMQILNDLTDPVRHFVATGVAHFYFREQIQSVIKPRFYPRLCQFLMKIIPVINFSQGLIKYIVIVPFLYLSSQSKVSSKKASNVAKSGDICFTKVCLLYEVWAWSCCHLGTVTNTNADWRTAA